MKQHIALPANRRLISIVFLIAILSMPALAAQGYLAFGLQKSLFAAGIGCVYVPEPSWGIGAVADVGADKLAVRPLFRFDWKQDWKTYLFGELAVGERKAGIGAGGGIEWDMRQGNPSRTPISWNLELGIGAAPEIHFELGFGILWRIE
ncbi:MAG: hypothetical protein FJY67_07860 [Calditrichaeota bacterium]|nr:hypothetical protein [Calditrichota bacterium]